jgi:hypothetical protein
MKRNLLIVLYMDHSEDGGLKLHKWVRQQILQDPESGQPDSTLTS